MSKTLLLVEDSFSIQKVVDSTFTTAGYEVVIADSARDGLNALSTITPDVILIDAAMTEMDGFQLCQAVRLTEGLAQVPVLLLTSRFVAYDEDLGKRVGVSAHLAKPFDSFTLYSLVQQLISVPPTPVFSATATPLPTEIAEAPLAVAASQPATSTAPEAAAIGNVYQTLGGNLQQIVEETVQTHLVTLLDALTPHLVEEVRSTLKTKVPELLERLLQQEIDKLKQVAQAETGASSTDTP